VLTVADALSVAPHGVNVVNSLDAGGDVTANRLAAGGCWLWNDAGWLYVAASLRTDHGLQAGGDVVAGGALQAGGIRLYNDGQGYLYSTASIRTDGALRALNLEATSGVQVNGLWLSNNDGYLYSGSAVHFGGGIIGGTHLSGNSISTPDSISAGNNVHCHGAYVAGALVIGGIQLYNDGAGRLYSSSSLRSWDLYADAGIFCGPGGLVTGGQVVAGYIRSTAALDVAHNIDVGMNGFFGDTVYCVGLGHRHNPGGAIHCHPHFSMNQGSCTFNQDLDVDDSFRSRPHGDCWVYRTLHGNISGGCDERYKRDISEVEYDALSALRGVKFYSFDRLTHEGRVAEHREHGIVAQQLRSLIPDAVTETQEPTALACPPDLTLIEWEELHPDRPSFGVDHLTLITYTMRAVQQLAERLDAVERS
jgi:hypothetical protein